MTTLTREAARFLLGAVRQQTVTSATAATAHLDITYRCDLDCEHCYLDDKSGARELPTRMWLEVLAGLQRLGVGSVVWSGGEALARPDFFQLLAEAHRLGLRSTLKTHAGNLAPEVALELKEHGVRRVDVSIYSLNAAVHDAVTRVPGSLARSLRGLAVARDAGLSPHVSVVVLRANQAELEAIEEFFVAFGAPVTFGTAMLADQSSRAALDALGVHGDELIDVYRTLARVDARRGLSTEAVRPLAPETTPCGAGRTLVYVGPDGSVWPCVTFPLDLGNVRDQQLDVIWRESSERARLVAWTNADRGDCSGCAAGGVCKYCPGEAMRRTGDYRVAPPRFHEHTRARAIALAEANGTALTPVQLASIPTVPIVPTPTRRAFFPIRAGAPPAPPK